MQPDGLMKTILCAFILMWSVVGFAADGGSLPVQQKPQEPEKPSLVKNGGDYFIDFKDGRVAGFFQQIGKPSRTYLKLRQIENTCDFGQVLAQCRFHMDITSRDLALRWVKHPEAAKIGEVVIALTDFSDGPKEEPIEQKADLFTWYTSRRENIYQTRMRRDRIVCDRLDWAKDLKQVDGKYIVHSWSSEAMTETTETGISENQTNSTVFDVRLNKLDETSFEVTGFGREGSAFSTGTPFLSNQVSTLNFLDKNNNSCMVSFESSVEELLKVFRSEKFAVTDPATRQSIKNTATIQSSALYFYLSFFNRNLIKVK